MKTRDIDEELNSAPKSEQEKLNQIQDAHNGKWVGFIVIIVGLAVALAVTWGINHVFSH